MREAVLFSLGETRYAIWRDQVASVERVGSLHRLPFLKSTLNVLAVIGDRTRTLADLPAFAGCPPARERNTAYALLMSEKAPVQGFLVTSEPESESISPDDVVPLPEYLSVPLVESCLDHDELPVPVIDVAALYAKLKTGATRIQATGFALAESTTAPIPESQDLRTFRAAGCLFAAPADMIAGKPLEGYRTLSFPFLPDDIDGIAVFRERILPVINLGKRVFHASADGQGAMLEASLGRETIGLVVDEDSDVWKSGSLALRALPPVTQFPWLRSAAVHAGEIASLLDIRALVSSHENAHTGQEASAQYALDSRFPSLFGSDEVKVVDFSFAGRKHAVPECEVAGVVPMESFRPVPRSSSIIAGVSDYKGRLVPVLDLSRIYGTSSQPHADWHMMEIVNGDFHALVLAETVSDARLIPARVQRPVPVALPFPVVYGCSTDGESVRLIFNIAELACHFEAPGVSDVVPSLAPEVSSAAEEGSPLSAEKAPPEEASVTAAPGSKPDEAQGACPEPESPQLMEDAFSEPPLPTNAEAPVDSRVEAGNENVAEEVEVVGGQAPGETGTALGLETPDAFVSADEAAPELEEPKVPGKSWGWRLFGFVISAAVIVALGAGLNFFEIPLTARASHVSRSRELIKQAARPAAPPAAAQAAVEPVAQPAAPASPPAAPAAVQPAQPGSSYIVKRGDTLWDIANKFTGNPLNYRAIAGQNRIADPDLIFPGQELKTSGN